MSPALAQTCRIKTDDARALALLGEAVRLAPTSPWPVNDDAVLLLEGALERAAHAQQAQASEDAGAREQASRILAQLDQAAG